MTSKEALKNITDCCNDGLYFKPTLGNVMLITNSITTIEKALKVLEIIKEKRIDIEALSKSDNYNEYNHFMQVSKSCVDNYKSLYFITPQKYKLLKEVLE